MCVRNALDHMGAEGGGHSFGEAFDNCKQVLCQVLLLISTLSCKQVLQEVLLLISTLSCKQVLRQVLLLIEIQAKEQRPLKMLRSLMLWPL